MRDFLKELCGSFDGQVAPRKGYEMSIEQTSATPATPTVKR